LLFRSFGALLPSNHAAAFNSQVITDPFGITQYGYPADDPVFKEDPDTFWRKYCTGPNSFTQAYNEYAAAHPDDTYTGVNGVPDNSPSGRKLKQIYPSTTGTNGCLLIQAAVGSAGAVFTDDVLAPNEKTNQSDATGGGGGGADQSPGSPPAQYAAAIAAHAPGRSHPEISVTIPPGAVPSDGRQYFAAVAHNGEVTACSFDKNKHCIYVKYRDPPGAGNTIEVPID
jgi:hypothetical protein